jgi:type IV pilus assembly protein PilV
MILIEVMVAAVVLAIGLLGVAALQVTALQGASNADYRSKAIDFASALSDRMHANLIAFGEYIEVSTHDNAYTNASAVDCKAAAPTKICAMPDSTEVSCNPTQIATYDLWDIICNGNGSLHKSLPGGQLTLKCLDNDISDADACSDLSTILITVSWQLQNDENKTTDQVIMTVVPGSP